MVVMRRSKSERDTPSRYIFKSRLLDFIFMINLSHSRKKNRNSKLLRNLGTMFRLSSKPQEVEQVQVQRRSKSSSSTNRKSLPGLFTQISNVSFKWAKRYLFRFSSRSYSISQ